MVSNKPPREKPEELWRCCPILELAFQLFPWRLGTGLVLSEILVTLVHRTTSTSLDCRDFLPGIFSHWSPSGQNNCHSHSEIETERLTCSCVTLTTHPLIYLWPRRNEACSLPMCSMWHHYCNCDKEFRAAHRADRCHVFPWKTKLQREILLMIPYWY